MKNIYSLMPGYSFECIIETKCSHCGRQILPGELVTGNYICSSKTVEIILPFCISCMPFIDVPGIQYRAGQ